MNYKHNLSLTDYLADTAPDYVGDRAREYYRQYLDTKIVYKLYGGEKPPAIECWMFWAYLHTINRSALYAEVIENAVKMLDEEKCLGFLIDVECPALIHQVEDGYTWWNYDAEKETPIWASLSEDAAICVEVRMSDTIKGIAETLRGLIYFFNMDILKTYPDPFNEAWLSASYDAGIINDVEYNSMLDKKYSDRD